MGKFKVIDCVDEFHVKVNAGYVDGIRYGDIFKVNHNLQEGKVVKLSPNECTLEPIGIINSFDYKILGELTVSSSALVCAIPTIEPFLSVNVDDSVEKVSLTPLTTP